MRTASRGALLDDQPDTLASRAALLELGKSPLATNERCRSPTVLAYGMSDQLSVSKMRAQREKPLVGEKKSERKSCVPTTHASPASPTPIDSSRS